MTVRLAALLASALVLSADAAAQSTSPPSQRELNGFLLGQRRAVVNFVLGKPYDEMTTADGWVYQVHVLDEAQNAYMVFKFPNDSDQAYALQIAGAPNTEMTAFLGLRLGDVRSAVVAVLGQPTQIERNEDLDLDVFHYADRNYTVELDSSGALSSIQVFGFDGFPGRPPGAPASLDAIEAVLVDADVGALLDLVSGDLEVSLDGTWHGYTQSPRAELSDTASRIAQALYSGPMSVRAALATVDRSKVDLNLRVHPDGSSGWVYHFPESSKLREVVLQSEAGRWRIWEIVFAESAS